MRTIAALTLAVLVVGCSSIAPGNDPFVVEAEKDLRTAFHVVDSFLAWEHANRATVGSDATKTADHLRRQFPGYLASAKTVLESYKANKDPGTRGSLETWLTTINTAMLQALAHLPSETAAKAYNQ